MPRQPSLPASPVTPLLATKPAKIDSFTENPALAALGKRLFFDERLSEPPGTSCASCHDPKRGYSGNHGSTKGVAAGSRNGAFAIRNTPSVKYLRYVPQRYVFLEDESPAPTPFGGFFYDGRANSIAEAIRGPLLDPREMNNRSEKFLAEKLGRLEYRAALADGISGDTPAALIDAAGRAIEAFLFSDEMSPFTSRFDDYLRGGKKLSPDEMNGLSLFKNPDKGNCASCHTVVDTSSKPARSLFTDFGFDAIAVPRNRASPANADPAFFDVGLCDTARRLKWEEAGQWCGYFKTANLRNVALRERFMHNGVFSDLRDAVAFYATRSTDPKLWYGAHRKFDDVPLRYVGNVNVSASPLNRREGVKPALTDSEIGDIVAFMKTLTDR